MSLEILGGTVVDLIFPQVGNLPQWPRHTEFTSTNLVLLNTPPLVTLGGNGANAAYVAARCGAAVTLHTRIGDDALGRLASSWLVSAGCQVCPVKSRGATAVNVTAANARHERATLFYAGAAPGLPRFAQIAPAPKALLVCGWPHPPLSRLAVCFGALRQRGTLTALDVGPLLNYIWTLAELRAVFPGLSLLLANAHEIRQLTRTKTIAGALGKLRAHYAGHVVVKCGPEGALWLPANEARARHIAPKMVRPFNTVGAGDSFNGGLLASLVAGRDYPRALQTAARVAASVVASKRGVLGVCP